MLEIVIEKTQQEIDQIRGALQILFIFNHYVIGNSPRGICEWLGTPPIGGPFEPPLCSKHRINFNQYVIVQINY